MARPTWTSFFNAARDPILFIFGLSGTVYETVVQKVDRPTLLAVYAGMMGLPAVLGVDRHNSHQSPPPPPAPHGDPTPAPAPPAPPIPPGPPA